MKTVVSECAGGTDDKCAGKCRGARAALDASAFQSCLDLCLSIFLRVFVAPWRYITPCRRYLRLE